MYQVLGRVYGGEQNFKEKHGPKKKKNTVRALMELTVEERAEDSEKHVWGSVLGG